MRSLCAGAGMYIFMRTYIPPNARARDLKEKKWQGWGGGAFKSTYHPNATEREPGIAFRSATVRRARGATLFLLCCSSFYKTTVYVRASSSSAAAAAADYPQRGLSLVQQVYIAILYMRTHF